MQALSLHFILQSEKNKEMKDDKSGLLIELNVLTLRSLCYVFWFKFNDKSSLIRVLVSDGPHEKGSTSCQLTQIY